MKWNWIRYKDIRFTDYLCIKIQKKGGDYMKLTNPVGRNVSLNADNDINPRACMCRNWFALSSVLGDSDNCSHCGCNCWPWNHGANASTASNTDRAKKELSH